MLSNLLRYGSIIAAIAGVFAIIGIARLQAERQLPPAGDPPLPPAPKPYAQAVSATGILEALSENVAIGVPQPGLVTEVKAKVNDTVKTGDTLFLLDDRDLRAQEISTKAKLEVARAGIVVSEAELAKTKSRLERFSAVTDPRAVSRDDLENLAQDVAVAEARLAAARAEQSAAESELQSLALLIERLTVRAPRDGTIIQVNIRAGRFPPAESNGVRYLLVPVALLLEAEAIFPPAVALKVDPDAAPGDDPYSDPAYQVPDDLVW